MQKHVINFAWPNGVQPAVDVWSQICGPQVLTEGNVAESTRWSSRNRLMSSQSSHVDLVARNESANCPDGATMYRVCKERGAMH